MLIEASDRQMKRFSKNINISICLVVDSIYMITGVARKRRIESINYNTQAISAGLNQMDYSICLIGRTKFGKRRLIKIINGNHQNVESAKLFYWKYLERYKSKFTEKKFTAAESLFVNQNLQTESFCFIGHKINMSIQSMKKKSYLLLMSI